MKNFTQEEMYNKVIDLFHAGVTEPTYNFLKELLEEYEIHYVLKFVRREVENYDRVFYYITKEDVDMLKNNKILKASCLKG